ncbi:uncharacterized protein LOC117287940 isoform X2 [Asterias rubens]|uniref:uncharacterized protein LOC117287940 isoform X2 n=1 Tax=Asterias rubens TaxID=7604 RepID=UPI0014554C45|nr:uncharacterized protein LOC117287940 isoform X2 [Asterias rubens]
MAEGVSTDPLLSKVILGHLECSICCTRYNQPKNLDCSHSYCLKCLQELKKTQNPDTNKLKCPLCQKETILPLDGVTGLQSNYLLIALVEEVNKQEQLPQDNPNVKTLNKEFQLLHQFTPGKESGSKPTCLAVDENNLIAVGYKDKGEVSLHNPDGSLIRTLSAPGIDKYMAVSNQRIIYTCNKKLIIVDYQGNKKIETTITECDKGLCCDTGGDIYVLYPKRIQHLSADQGTHVEWININQTDGDTITCTQQGKLVIEKTIFWASTLFIYHRIVTR